MTLRVRIALGGAALIGPLAAFPTLMRPQIAIALCLCALFVFLASKSIAYPLAFFGLPGVVIALIGTNPFPNNSVELFLVGWLVLGILLTLLREENALPLRLIVSGPVLMTLGLAILMVARLGASTEPQYGSYKLQLFLAENVSFLIAGILVARTRRHLNLWVGLLLCTVASGSFVLLQSLLAGGAKEVLPGRLALYAQADPIALARGAATGLLLATFVLLAAPAAWRRAAALALIPVVGVAFIGAGSRGPVVGLVAGLFVLLALSLGERASRRRLLLLGAALLVSAVMIPQLVPGQNVSRSLSVLTGGGKDAGGGDVSNGRTQLWGEAWHQFGNHPFTGIGTGSFAHVDPVGIYPHNAFLEAAAELGFPGLLLFSGLVGLAFVHAGRAWRWSTGEDRHHASLVTAYLGAAVVNAQFSGDFARNGAVWLGAGLALGLVQRIVPSSPEREPLGRLRTRWRQRGTGAPELIDARGSRQLPPPSPPRQPAPGRSAIGGTITSPESGSAIRGEVVVTCRPGGAGWSVGSVTIEASTGGRGWFEVAEATADQDFEVFVVTPGGGRRHVAVLRSRDRAEEMREALAGEHGVTPDKVEIRPAKRSRWAGKDAREGMWDTSGVEDGEYQLRTLTTDVTGRRAEGTEITVLVDNTAPSLQLESPQQGAVLMGVVDVAAKARDEGSGLTLVRFEYGTGDDEWVEIGTRTAAPYRASWNTGVLGEGDYLLRAIALDRAGNEALSKTIPVRVERVVAAVKLEDPGACLARTVRLRATVRNEAKTTGVEFQIARADTFAWQALGAVPRPPFELDVDTIRVEDGVYDFRAVARDKARGIDASRIVRARRIDNIAPTVSVFEPSEGAVLRGEVPISARASDQGSGITAVLFQFSRDDQTWRPVVTRGGNGGAVYWDTAKVEDGEYALRAVVGDAAGNLATSDQLSVLVDNTPPVLTLDEPLPGATVAGSVRLRASAHDGDSGVIAVRFELSQDQVAWGELAVTTVPPYAWSWDTTRVADGVYRVRAVACDRAGNCTFGEPADVTVRNTLVFEPLPPAPVVEAVVPEPEPEPAPEKVSFDTATLWQLERVLEQRGAGLENRDELEALLYTLRPYARPDGTIPERFWPLLWDSFGDLLEGK